VIKDAIRLDIPDRDCACLIISSTLSVRRWSHNYLDLAADGDMSREDLRAKLAEVGGQLEATRTFCGKH